MSLRHLKNLYEKRRNTLVSLLNENSKIDKTRRDQIVGAITEIDTLLKTVEQLREQEIEDNKKLELLNLEVRNINPLNLPILNKVKEKVRARFDQSRTKQNLFNLFLKKCEARIKYELYSRYAKQEGYEHISKLFKELSEQEFEHIRVIYGFLNLEKSTYENIKDAAYVEQLFHDKFYTEYENIAKQEKLKDIEEFLKELANIDEEHEKTFLRLLKLYHEKKIFRSEHVVKWKCKKCGYKTESKEAPKKCKICSANRGYFSTMNEFL